jgi:hypothetical protein
VTAPPCPRFVTAVAAVAAVTAILLVAACGTDRSAGGPASTAATTTGPDIASTPPDGVSLFADYPRYLWHKRRLSVATTNDRDLPIQVSVIALRTDHFLDLEPEPKSTTIAPGARVDIQTDFGELRSCDDEPGREPMVLMRIATEPGGTTDDYLIPIDPAPLDDIRRIECAARRVDDAATIGFSDERSIDGLVMTTGIDVARLDGDEPVGISSIQGSVIITMKPIAAAAEPLLTLAPGASSGTVPIELEITRCDPHAVGQSTLTFVLSAFVTIGDAAPHKLTLDLDADMRAELQAMITECSEQLTADG